MTGTNAIIGLTYDPHPYSLPLKNSPERAVSHGGLQFIALPGLPLVGPGDDLAGLIESALQRLAIRLMHRDVLVVAQKIVSKAEDRFVYLDAVQPSSKALALAEETGKDPRLVEVILGESRRIVGHRRDVLIVEHRLGFVMANAGVDSSNVGPSDGRQRVLLLPEDPDASAAELRERLMGRFDCDIGIVVSDSFGRAWRRGSTGVAIGVAGLPALLDLRGQPDLFARELEVTMVGFADQVAAGAALAIGEAAEGTPVVLARGLDWSQQATNAQALIRPPGEDLFR